MVKVELDWRLAVQKLVVLLVLTMALFALVAGVVNSFAPSAGVGAFIAVLGIWWAISLYEGHRSQLVVEYTTMSNSTQKDALNRYYQRLSIFRFYTNLRRFQ